MSSAALSGLGSAALLLSAGMSFGTPVAVQVGGAAVVQRLNQVRLSGVTCPDSGVRPAVGVLRPSPLHAAAAFLQSKYLALSGEVSHLGRDGGTPQQRAAGLGLRAVSVTEIIYLAHSPDLESAVQWWLHSPVHCKIITDPRYSVAGGSVVQGRQGTAYVVVLSSAK
ncbi:CAP domain-containing protein [Deinococcus sp.]|uniref:CAP domain-containing protein n=1 Tax=Deinococcus sp. TaxID=47478 RepID=UPI003C7C2131